MFACQPLGQLTSSSECQAISAQTIKQLFLAMNVVHQENGYVILLQLQDSMFFWMRISFWNNAIRDKIDHFQRGINIIYQWMKLWWKKTMTIWQEWQIYFILKINLSITTYSLLKIVFSKISIDQVKFFSIIFKEINWTTCDIIGIVKGQSWQGCFFSQSIIYIHWR